MNDPELIWRLGRWIARRESGAARLAWSEGEVILRVHVGKIVSIEGLDPGQLAHQLGSESRGHRDLLEEARAQAKQEHVTETQAMGAAKEILQRAIHEWLMDRSRQLELVDGEPDVPEGPTVSITHTIVELVLSDTEHDVYRQILPDLGVLVRRTAKFLELYSPLRLSEDADLIVAKITGQRTVEEIVTRSPHAREDVLRLLAALVTTGMLEPIPVVTPSREDDLLPAELPDQPRTARRLHVGWILGGVVAMAVALAVLSYLLPRGGGSQTPLREGTWTVVVDMGCEPEDLRRVLQKANENPKSLRAVRATLAEGDECWRLVWGEFANRETAEQEMAEIPATLTRDGFEPHVIEFVELVEPEEPAETGDASDGGET